MWHFRLVHLAEERLRKVNYRDFPLACPFGSYAAGSSAVVAEVAASGDDA